jgi:hypothetical protein
VRTTIFLGICLLWMTPGQTVGQQRYTIRLKEMGTGDLSRMERKNSTSFKTKLVIDKDGEAREEEQSVGTHQVFTQTVLARPAGADRPTKLERKYDKAVTESAGMPGKNGVAPSALEGKTLIIEKRGERYEFRLGGTEQFDSPELEGEFNKAQASDRKKLLVPDKAVAEGESWTIDPRSLLSAEKGQKLEIVKANGVAKLSKVFQKDGATFGTIATDIECLFRITGAVPEGKGELTSENKITVKLQFDGCIDGTRAHGSVVSTAEFTNTTVFRGPDKSPPQTTIVRGTTRYEDSWQPLRQK